MPTPFSSLTTFGCEGENLPNAITFAQLSLATPLSVEPILQGELFGFPLPLPLTPIGCACIPATVNVTGLSTQPLMASAQFIPRNGDCCDLSFLLSLNIPPSTGLPPICGPGDLDFDLNVQSAVKGSQFGLTGGFAADGNCAFDLNLGLTFDCAMFPTTSHHASIVRPRQWNNSIRLSVVPLPAADECAFGIDLALELPCITPRIGAKAVFNSLLSKPVALVRFQTPPGTQSSTVSSNGKIKSVPAGGSSTKFEVDVTASGLAFAGDPFLPNYFVGCSLKFTSGANNNVARPITSYGQGWNWPLVLNEGVGFTFVTPFPSNFSVNDLFTVECVNLSTPDTTPVNECDRLWNVEIQIPTISPGGGSSGSVQCGVIVGQGAIGSGEYSVRFCDTPAGTPVTAYNYVEYTNSPNLEHDRVPIDVPVLLFKDTVSNTWWFHHYIEPLDEACVSGSFALGSAAARDIIRLWGSPAGSPKCIVNDATAEWEIVCPDVNGIGWLPISAVPESYSVGAPLGAKFWYNLPTHPIGNRTTSFESALNAAIVVSPNLISIMVDGVETTIRISVAAFNHVPEGDEDPLIVVTDYGLWWMKSSYGNVPWADDMYSTFANCSYDYSSCSYYRVLPIVSKRIVIHMG